MNKKIIVLLLVVFCLASTIIISVFGNCVLIKIFAASKITLSPSSEINIISGENAQGKTNLIEEIWFFTGAKSFRGIKDTEAIKKGCEKAKIKLNFVSLGIEKNAEIEIITVE